MFNSLISPGRGVLIRFCTVAIFLSALSAGAGAANPTLDREDPGCSPTPALYHSIAAKIASCQPNLSTVGDVYARSEERASTYYIRGLLYHLASKYDLAIADYTASIGWARNNEDPYEARGDAYEDMGQHDKAAADYAQAASLESARPEALLARCWVRAVRGHPLQRALADCNSALNGGSDEKETLDYNDEA